MSLTPKLDAAVAKVIRRDVGRYLAALKRQDKRAAALHLRRILIMARPAHTTLDSFLAR